MLKAWFVSLLIAVLFAIAYVTDLFAFLAWRGFFYFSLGLVIAGLIAAVIILGNPLDGNKNHDESAK